MTKKRETYFRQRPRQYPHTEQPPASGLCCRSGSWTRTRARRSSRAPPRLQARGESSIHKIQDASKKHNKPRCPRGSRATCTARQRASGESKHDAYGSDQTAVAAGSVPGAGSQSSHPPPVGVAGRPANCAITRSVSLHARSRARRRPRARRGAAGATEKDCQVLQDIGCSLVNGAAHCVYCQRLCASHEFTLSPSQPRVPHSLSAAPACRTPSR